MHFIILSHRQNKALAVHRHVLKALQNQPGDQMFRNSQVENKHNPTCSGDFFFSYGSGPGGVIRPGSTSMLIPSRRRHDV